LINYYSSSPSPTKKSLSNVEFYKKNHFQNEASFESEYSNVNLLRKKSHSNLKLFNNSIKQQVSHSSMNQLNMSKFHNSSHSSQNKGSILKPVPPVSFAKLVEMSIHSKQVNSPMTFSINRKPLTRSIFLGFQIPHQASINQL
jgi:hypothetical protein